MKKEIPNNIDAEQSVLGAMMLSKYALGKAIESLTENSFYLEKHKKIFKALKSLSSKDIAIDITILTNELKDMNALDEIGGIDYLTEILELTPTAANVEYYIDIVEQKSILRNLIDVSTDIATLGYSSEYSINEVLDKAESKMVSLMKNRKSSEFKEIPEVLKKYKLELEKLSKSKGKISGLPTGFYDFDNLTDGFHPNELIILAARPGMGKTAFALNIATNVALKTKKTVLIFNLEMRAEQLVSRMIASVGQLDGRKLQNGSLETSDWQRVNEAMSTLSDTNIYIDDTAGITIGEIKSKCRRIASTDENLGLIVIDYLTLISSAQSFGGNRQQQVSEISRALKTLALELEVPILTLAQLSRTPELRENKRPILSDLRESGSIEQDADVVTFIYSDDYYADPNARNDVIETEIIVRKNRSGKVGTSKLLFKKNNQSFMNFSNKEEKVNQGE